MHDPDPEQTDNSSRPEYGDIPASQDAEPYIDAPTGDED